MLNWASKPNSKITLLKTCLLLGHSFRGLSLHANGEVILTSGNSSWLTPDIQKASLVTWDRSASIADWISSIGTACPDLYRAN